MKHFCSKQTLYAYLWAFRHLIHMRTSECDSHLQNSPCQDLLFQSKKHKTKKKTLLLSPLIQSLFFPLYQNITPDQLRSGAGSSLWSGRENRSMSSSIRIHPSSCLSIMPLVGGASSPPECLRSQSASQSRRNHIRRQHPPWNRPLEKASSVWGLHEGTFMNIHHGAL